MTKWRDITSYSRGENPKIPRTYDLELGALRIVVTRHFHYPPDVWTFYCREIGFTESVELKSRDITEAQKEALYRAQSRLVAMLAKVSQAL